MHWFNRQLVHGFNRQLSTYEEKSGEIIVCMWTGGKETRTVKGENFTYP